MPKTPHFRADISWIQNDFRCGDLSKSFFSSLPGARKAVQLGFIALEMLLQTFALTVAPYPVAGSDIASARGRQEIRCSKPLRDRGCGRGSSCDRRWAD
ncbi:MULTISPECIES: hypothetical protein [Paracoccus]|uniref:hypothetical protein n=1 Tax=Paracoccus TaxID=265 RepID=UPI000E280B41|nr:MULTISPECIES: hypothetical protein [Paracoccus]